MKRPLVYMLPIVGLAVALSIAACGSFKDGPTTPENPGSGSSTEQQMDATTLTIEDYLYEHDGALAETIATGEIPVKLHYFAANSADGEITSEDTIYDILSTLLAVKVDFSKTQNVGIDDGDAIFIFTWDDGTELYLSFLTSDYFQSSSDLYRVVDGEHVSYAMNQAYWALSDDGGSDVEDTIDAFTDGNVIIWDSDGDGESEVYYIEHYDNGDEAPNVIEISLADDPEIGVIINGGYDLLDVADVELEDGKHALSIKYTVGDYYNHDRKETVLVTRAYSDDGDFEEIENEDAVLDGNGLA